MFIRLNKEKCNICYTLHIKIKIILKIKKNKILLMLHVTRYTFLKITIKIGLIEFF